ncbi:glyoxalase [Microbacterium sp. CH12i]|uniref:hypothetical protein n=1 Tax=Microbacterium sp. CH12i TaxID=1479651 RepID=UPI00046128EE|nr:hypothetical protein [Microbacterium sp. CH12i]KDA06265.1 glyoxalase [Microbacterium sp. CH12i]
MTVVQQIVYTERPERWWVLAEVLGFVAPYPPSPEWGEFHADGVLAVHGARGSVGLHSGDARIGLSFEARGDLDALASGLRDAGFEASVVDEAFARTIRVPDPDGGDEIWVNGTQDDLHGYHRVG